MTWKDRIYFLEKKKEKEQKSKWKNETVEDMRNKKKTYIDTYVCIYLFDDTKRMIKKKRKRDH